MFGRSSSLSAVEAGFCYPSKVSLARAEKALVSMLVPGEKLITKTAGGCLEVTLKSFQRYELMIKLQKLSPGLRNYYLLSRDSESKVLDNAPSAIRPGASRQKQAIYSGINCRFYLHKQEKVQTRGTQVSMVGRPDISQSHSEKTVVSKMMLIAQNGLPASFEAMGVRVWYRCKAGMKNGIYQLKLSLLEHSNAVSTSVSLAPGQTLEIAQMIKDLSEKQRKIGGPRGIEIRQIKGQKNSSIQLVRK